MSAETNVAIEEKSEVSAPIKGEDEKAPALEDIGSSSEFADDLISDTQLFEEDEKKEDPAGEADAEDSIQPSEPTGDEQPVAEDKTPDAKEIPADLRERASIVGLSREDMGGISDPDLFERIVGRYEASKPPAAEVLPVAKEPEQPAPDLEFDFDPEIYGENFSKGLSNGLKGVFGAQGKLIQELQGRVEKAEQTIQSQQVLGVVEEVDGLFKGLGSAYHEVLGNGATGSFRAGSQERENRDAILTEMSITAAGHQQLGKPVPNTSELFERAVRACQPGVEKTAGDAKLQKQLRDRKKQFTSPPASRKKAPKAQTAEEKVLDKINSDPDKYGTSDGDDTAADDFFPE